MSFLWNCCTPDYRKKPSSLSSQKPPKSSNRFRSMSTADLPRSSRSSSGKNSPPEPLFRDRLRLMSYNIFMRPNNPVAATDEYQDVRAQMFLDHVLPNYDIVCLQEMFSMPLSSRRHEFIERAREQGFFWSHASSRTHSLSPTIDGGLLVLSRLPIVRKDILNFTSAAFADWYASKGVLYCLVKVGPTEKHYMHVFCTHLQATYDDKGKAVSEKVRKEQLAQAIAFVNKCVINREEWPIVICGDLNVQCRKSNDDGTDSEEYLNMLSMMKAGFGVKGELLRDLAKEIDGVTHPVTYGDAHFDEHGNVELREVSLTDVTTLKQSTQWCNQSLDKVFFIPSMEQIGSIEPLDTTINPILIQSDAWNVNPGSPLTHLSDHYAVETNLRVALDDIK